jgi:hypothetical protein
VAGIVAGLSQRSLQEHGVRVPATVIGKRSERKSDAERTYLIFYLYTDADGSEHERRATVPYRLYRELHEAMSSRNPG